MATPVPSVMRMVLFVMPSGAIRPAVVHEVHSDTCVSLSVFAGESDGIGQPVMRATSVTQDQETKKPHTWHWNDYQVASGEPSH